MEYVITTGLVGYTVNVFLILAGIGLIVLLIGVIMLVNEKYLYRYEMIINVILIVGIVLLISMSLAWAATQTQNKAVSVSQLEQALPSKLALNDENREELEMLLESVSGNRSTNWTEIEILSMGESNGTPASPKNFIVSATRTSDDTIEVRFSESTDDDEYTPVFEGETE